MLPQASSPAITKKRHLIGIFQSTVTAHAADEIHTISRSAGAVNSDLIARCADSTVTIAATRGYVGIVQMGSMQAGSPLNTLCVREIIVRFSEAQMTRGTFARGSDAIRPVLVCICIDRHQQQSERYRYTKHLYK